MKLILIRIQRGIVQGWTGAVAQKFTEELLPSQNVDLVGGKLVHLPYRITTRSEATPNVNTIGKNHIVLAQS